MLSIENNPPDPPCSHNFSGLRNDERASSATVALEGADLLNSDLADDNHRPTFSIRDYAFKARSKGIEKSWPFSQEYLEVCLKSGHKVPLPSFEPPDLVRRRFPGNYSDLEVNSLEGVNIVLDGESQRSESNSSLPIDESVVGLSNQTQSPLKEQENIKEGLSGTDLCRLSTIRDLDEIGEEGLPTITSNAQSEEGISTSSLPCSGEVGTTDTSSQALIELEVNPEASRKNICSIESPSKKSKSIEKVGVVSNTSRVEDIVSNITTISEPMASKVCPVCKTFLSTSNTTLNAHIDQCLAVQSPFKTTVKGRLSMHKIKPTKYRMMVDIYATAPHCTLEELDKRNGSNWAADLSSPAADLSSPTADAEVSADGKRQRLSQVDDLEDTSDESAVYFDSNGRKLRILSKLDDSLVPRSGENSKSRKHMNENKERNIRLSGKVKRLRTIDSKHQKFKPQNKKLRSLKSNGPKISGAPEGNYGLDENCEKEDSPSGLSKDCDPTNPVKLGQWVCAKRTDLPKKPNGKHARRGLGYTSLMMQDLLIQSNQYNLSNTPMETSYVQELPKSSEDASPSQKTDKEEKSPKQNHPNRLSDDNTSPMHVGSKLKFSMSSQSHASSPRSKRVEIQNAENFEGEGLPKRTVENQSEIRNPVLPKGEKLSTPRKNVLSDKSPKSNFNEDGKRYPLRKSRMRRCMTKASVQARKVQWYVDEQYDQMHNDPENNCQKLDQIRSTRKSDRPNKFTRSEEMAIGRSEAHVSEQGRETSRTLGRKESKALEGFEPGFKTSTIDSGVGVHSNNGMEFASKEVPLNGEDTIMQPYTEKASQHPVTRSREISMSVCPKACTLTNTQPNCFQSIEENERPVFGNEAERCSCEQHFCDGQASAFTKSVSNIIQGMASDVDCSVGGNSPSEIEQTECGAETISIPGPPGFFLPSPGDSSSEVRVENSSLTSNRLPSSQDRSLMVDRDSSGFPVSATSTISQLHTARPDSNNVELKSLVGPPEVLERFILGFSSDGSAKPLARGDITAFSSALNVQNAERMNLDMESIKATKESLVEEYLKISDDHPCRCSRKERVPWNDSLTYQDLQLPRQHNMATSVPPSMEAQVNCNLKIRPEVSASSSGCSSSNINEKAVPLLGSPRDSVALRTSSHAALKSPGYGDFGSTSSLSQQAHLTQSNSNPVLRLMGKTFMVVNKEEGSSLEIKAPVDPDSNYSMLSGFSTGNMTSENCSSLYRMASDGSVIFNHDIYKPPVNRFDGNLSNTPGSHSSSRNHHTNSQPLAGNHGNNHHMGVFPGPVHHTSLQPPAGNHSNNHHVGAFLGSFRHTNSQPPAGNHSNNHHIEAFPASLLSHGSNNMIGCFQTLQESLAERSNAMFRYNDGRRGIAAPQDNQNPASASYAAANSMREVIVIDDSPENEADLSRNYTEESRRRQIFAGGILPSSHPSSSLRQVNNPFYSYPSQNAFSQRETPVGTYPMLCPKGGTGSPANPGDNSQGSGLNLHSSIGPVYRRPIL